MNDNFIRLWLFSLYPQPFCSSSHVEISPVNLDIRHCVSLKLSPVSARASAGNRRHDELRIKLGGPRGPRCSLPEGSADRSSSQCGAIAGFSRHTSSYKVLTLLS